MRRFLKHQSTKMLIIYLIGALLFLTSVDLHIHTQQAAASEEHGAAVAISSLSSEFLPDIINDEITVSPDSVLKVDQSDVDLFVVFLLVAIFAIVTLNSFASRLRELHAMLPGESTYNSPLLRAPPLNSNI